MNRGWARTLASISLLPLLGSLGCDALTARPLAGTVMAFTLDGLTASTIPVGQHLELWARTQYDDVVRVDGYWDQNNGKSANGLMIRQAVSLKDPCLIDGYYFANNKGGNLLTTPAAFPSATTVGGVTQTPAELAQQVINRIHQLTDAPGANGPLWAVLPYDPNLPPTLPDSATSEERRAACDAYIGSSPLTYVANPYQITGPLHGTVYGFVKFISTIPPANYDGFRIDTPIKLQGVQEIFFTVEGRQRRPEEPRAAVHDLADDHRRARRRPFRSDSRGPDGHRLGHRVVARRSRRGPGPVLSALGTGLRRSV